VSAAQTWIEDVVAGMAHLDWAVVSHAVPVILIAARAKIDALPPGMRGLVQDFSVRSGLDRASTPEEAEAAIHAYYEREPIDPRVLAVLDQIAQRYNATQTSEIDVRAWAGLNGAKRALAQPEKAPGPSPLFALLADRSKS
jgi:hypothetical protein